MTDAERKAEIERLNRKIDDCRRVLAHGLPDNSIGVYACHLVERRNELLRQLTIPSGNVASGD